jgi:uncharacterized membrane protein
LFARILNPSLRADPEKPAHIHLNLVAVPQPGSNPMTTYLLLKWIHILSSVLLVGTGFGSAFYLFFTHRTRNVQAIAEVARLVVKADFWFTTPAIIIQPVTGFWMMTMTGYNFSQTWLLWTLACYLLAGICWLPVVWLQFKMRDMAAVAAEGNFVLSKQYWDYAKYWEWLGYPAFIAMLGVYGLMVFKPM